MAKFAVLHGNEGGHPTRPATVPNYVSGGPVFTNRGSGTQEGGQYWFDNSAKMPFGKGMAMESSGSSPCAIASETQIVVSGPFKHKIWIDRLDDSHRVLWSMGTNGREDGAQYLGIRGRPQGGGLFKLDLFGRDSGVGATLALSPSFAFPSNDGTPRLIVTERDSAGYLKLSLDGELIATSAAPWNVSITGYLAIFGSYDRVNQSAEGVYRASTGEMEFTVDEADLVYPFTVPTSRFTVDSTDVTVELTGVGGTGVQGTVESSFGKSLTSVLGTGAVGTVVQSRTKALTNNVGTGAAGTIVQSRSLDTSGVEAAGLVGDVAVDGTADVTVAISGVEASSNGGAVGAAIDLSLTGIEGASSVGDSVAALSFGLSGVSALEGAGTLAAGFASGLSAASASGSVGTTASSLSLALSGQFATGDAGIFVPSASAALTGMQADAAVGDVAIAGAGPGGALSGVQGTASLGAVGMSVTISLAGVAGSAFAGYVAPPASQVVLGSLIGRTRQAFGVRSSVQTSTRRNEQSSKR